PRLLGRRMELVAQRADGSQFPAELAVVPVDLGGAPVFVGFVRDITQRKQAEEELRALNATLEQRVAERSAAAEQARATAEPASRASRQSRSRSATSWWRR